MPSFGIRWTSYTNAHPPKGEKPLPYEDWNVDEETTFSSFDEAKEFAKDATENSRYNDYWDDTPSLREPRYQYVAFKLPSEQDYHQREHERIQVGKYELLPEHMRPEGTYHAYMFPRLVERQGKKLIGYFASPSDAHYDRLTEIKPTKYFNAYFDDDKTWDYMAELGLISGEVGLAFLTTREDIRFAYENGPESCMAGPASDYHNPHIHPAEAYASPDLALAVLYRGEKWQDNIVGRALCNVHTKTYVRIYGDINRMKKMLEAEGYCLDQYALGGCRLLKIFGCDYEEPERVRRSVIMVPYLDGCCQKITLEKTTDEFMTIEPEKIRIICSTAGYYNMGGDD
jgi:hypothetical protein